jgi:hypothetical protein
MSEIDWYIIQEASEQCRIVSAEELETREEPPAQKWGPFRTQNQAIAKRVGLIRAGKCKPS